MAEERETRPRLPGRGIRYARRVVPLVDGYHPVLCATGAARVPVADCREQQFDSHCKTEMKMSDYLCYWRSLVEGREREEGGGRGEEGRGGRAHMEEEGGRGEREQTQERDREKNEPPLLYLKDWHFFKLGHPHLPNPTPSPSPLPSPPRQYPEYGAYTVPPFFTADWLNEVWDQREDVRDDYRFVYFGPMGTW